jgi:hypothetical protein
VKSAALAALLVAACGATQPTPAETAVVARQALVALSALCARMPEGTDPKLARACSALAKADELVTDTCAASPLDASSAGAGGSP